MSQFDDLMNKKEIPEIVEIKPPEIKPIKPKPKKPKIDYEQKLEDMYNPPIEFVMSAFKMISGISYHENKIKVLNRLEAYIPRLREKLIELKKNKK